LYATLPCHGAQRYPLLLTESAKLSANRQHVGFLSWAMVAKRLWATSYTLRVWLPDPPTGTKRVCSRRPAPASPSRPLDPPLRAELFRIISRQDAPRSFGMRQRTPFLRRAPKQRHSYVKHFTSERRSRGKRASRQPFPIEA
jgi:hypothetical protein